MQMKIPCLWGQIFSLERHQAVFNRGSSRHLTFFLRGNGDRHDRIFQWMVRNAEAVSRSEPCFCFCTMC